MRGAEADEVLADDVDVLAVPGGLETVLHAAAGGFAIVATGAEAGVEHWVEWREGEMGRE